MSRSLKQRLQENNKPLKVFFPFYVVVFLINVLTYAISNLVAHSSPMLSVVIAFAISSISGSVILAYIVYTKKYKQPFSIVFLFCLGWLGSGVVTGFLYYQFSFFLTGTRALMIYIFIMIFFIPVNLLWLWFYEKWPEMIRYLVGGFLVFLISFSCYFVLTRIVYTQAMLANIISWIISNAFGFVINKYWVFQKESSNFKEFMMELVNFFSGRLLTSIVLDFGLFALLFYGFGMNDILIKVICTILVVIANYFWSVLLTFSKKSKENDMIILGDGISLRSIAAEDTDNIVMWRNNPNIKRNFIYQEDFTNEKHMQWLNNKVLTGECVQFIIHDIESNKDIGSAFLRDIDKVNKKAEYGFFIGDVESQNKGIGTKTTKMIVEYGFNELGLHKIFARILSFNQISLGSFKKAGFSVDGIFKDDVYINEEYHDVVFVSVINAE